MSENEILEKLCEWAIKNGFSTGHADTIDDFLYELHLEIKDLKDIKSKNQLNGK